MQLGKVINLKNYSKYLDFIKKNKYIFLLMMLFIVGLFIGISSINEYEGFKDFFIHKVEEYLDLRYNGNLFNIFIHSFMFYLIFIVIAFVFGSSIIGVVFIPFIICGCSFLYGGYISTLYSSYSLKGIAFSAIFLIPPTVLFSVGLILACCESVGFSIRIIKLTLPKTNPSNLYYDFKNYFGRYLYIILLIIFAALADGLLSINFINNFTL